MVKSLKALLLTAIALAAFAAPAAASGAVWLHEGVPLEEHVEADLAGTEVFQTPKGGMVCETQATLTTSGGSTAQLTAFHISGEGCLKFGELTECELVSGEGQNLPWDVDVNAENLTVTGAEIHRTFDSECPIGEIDSEIAELSARPDDPKAIGELTLEGEGTAVIDMTSEIGYSSFGSLVFEESEAGTYGIA